MGEIGINYKNGVSQGFHEHRRNWKKLQNGWGWVKVSMSIGGVFKYFTNCWCWFQTKHWRRSFNYFTIVG
jgi:hypothetical protein